MLLIFDMYLKIYCHFCGGFSPCFRSLSPCLFPSAQSKIIVYYLVTSGILNRKSLFLDNSEVKENIELFLQFGVFRPWIINIHLPIAGTDSWNPF